MRMLRLNQVTGEGDFGLTGEAGEDDQPITTAETVPTMPLVIMLGPDPSTTIRSWTPRKAGKPGTRLVTVSGAAFPVIETPSQVEGLILQLYN